MHETATSKKPVGLDVAKIIAATEKYNNPIERMAATQNVVDSVLDAISNSDLPIEEASDYSVLVDSARLGDKSAEVQSYAIVMALTKGERDEILAELAGQANSGFGQWKEKHQKAAKVLFSNLDGMTNEHRRITLLSAIESEESSRRIDQMTASEYNKPYTPDLNRLQILKGYKDLLNPPAGVPALGISTPA